MIDGKQSYRIFLHDDEEVNKFKEFIIRNNGDKSRLTNKYLIPHQLYEVSVELKYHQLNLVGYCSHIGYPASTRFTNNLDGFIFWYENEYLGLKDVEIIKHIPHASLDFPKEYDESSKYLIYGLDYKKQNFKLADLFVDELFSDIPGITIKAKYSRMYCDVERYKDDNKEPMTKYGQGYIYTKNIFGGRDYLRNLTSDGADLLEGIDVYYDEHHHRLTEEVKNILSKGKKVLILDLHSFSEELVSKLGKNAPYPDICIGLNSGNFDQRIVNAIIDRIKKKGYTYQINYPYEGSILPTGLSKEELDNVYSVMIEVNKRVYL